MPLSVTDAEIIRKALESRAGDIYTCLPGRVEKYYPDLQTADVVPVIRRAIANADGDISTETLPVIPNVKVCFPTGGGFTVTWPIVAGNHVTLLFLIYACTQWRITGQISDPGDLRIHALGSALALPNHVPNSGAVPESQASDNAYIITGPMIKLGAADASDFAALSSKVDANFQKIKNMFTSWVVVPNDGGGALKTLSGSLSFDDTSCTKVKIK